MTLGPKVFSHSMTMGLTAFSHSMTLGPKEFSPSMTLGPTIFSHSTTLDPTIYLHFMTLGPTVLSQSMILGPTVFSHSMTLVYSLQLFILCNWFILAFPVDLIHLKTSYAWFADPYAKGTKIQIGWGKDVPLSTQCSLVKWKHLYSQKQVLTIRNVRLFLL